MPEQQPPSPSPEEMRPSPEEMRPSPEEMRLAMCDYVAALHGAYLDVAAQLTPGERAEMPLVRAGSFTVAAVGAGHLHVLGTTAPLPPITGPEVEMSGSDRGLSWSVRFFDPVLLPELGIIDESAGPDPLAVRSALGIADVVYHLSVGVGGGLSAHHAQHAGTGLANAHSASARDYDGMRAYAPRQTRLIDEFSTAQRLGLTTAARLLAHEIAPHSPEVAAADEPAALRRAVLAALRPPTAVAT